MSLSTKFANEITQIHKLAASQRLEPYGNLLEQIYAQPTASLEQDLNAYLVSVLNDNKTIVGVQPSSEPLSIIASRQLLSSFTEKLSKHPNAEVQVDVARSALQLIQPRVAAFEDQDTALKLLQATAHEAQEEYRQSAQVLSTISLESTSRNVSDTDRARVWVRIMRCYLEEDDPTAASAAVNRVKNVQHNINDPIVLLQFRLSSARILDAQRQFLDASNAYHTVSFDPMVDEDDRLQTLSAAISCAVLAPAGPQRSRALARLYKDERASQVESYAILEKIFLDRVLTAAEVTSFASKLPEHQLARTSDGSTVLDRAVLEHNLLGASRLYRNIGIEQLGNLLGVDAERAEEYAAQMIEQGRLNASIDQLDSVIFFEDSSSGDKKQVSTSELRRWDANVQGLTEAVEQVTTLIQSIAPEFYAVNMT